MPTRRVQKQFVPQTQMSTTDWCEVIEEWLLVLKPIFKNRHLPLMETAYVGQHLTLGELWKESYGSASIDPDYHVEGIWGTAEHVYQYGGDVTKAFWGRTRDGEWLNVEVTFRIGSDGHRGFHRLLSVDVSETSLQELVERRGADYILWSIRNELWRFQEQARQIAGKLDYAASRLDEDYELMALSGIELPRNPDWSH